MLQIGYFSASVGRQDAATVHDILRVARRDNQRDGITGLLVAGAGRYLQIIEGPEQPLRVLYAKIARDKRHMAVTRFLHRHTAERSFGSWSMAFRWRTEVGETDTFGALLRSLTTEVRDRQLQQQIAFFSRALVESDFGAVGEISPNVSAYELKQSAREPRQNVRWR